MSRRQTVVALSTAEAEYIAACEATMEEVAESNILQEILPHKKELIIKLHTHWLQILFIGDEQDTSNCDSTLFQVQKGIINLEKVKDNVNPADALTKALDKRRLQELLQLIGIEDAK
ncbi:Copiatype Polyprotein [Phytophthora palmivora]|uniref:Copiatype Polyprotein n=1 Tax=Phytophthora palmivora TaxID=4796 RepID=A0A2P4XEU8_9STRA|nr:Copiatype Polyprotein [Phytophthora palmivora]